jgi:hypothetical protein
MNVGGFPGAHSNGFSKEFGKLVRAIDYQNSDYVRLIADDIRVPAPEAYRKQFPALNYKTIPAPFGVNWILWTGSLYAAISDSHFSTSTDLVTWTTPVALPAIASTSRWVKLGYNGSQFVIASEDNSYSAPSGNVYTAYSTTGASWTAGTTITGLGSGFSISPIYWDGVVWVFSGVGGGNQNGIIRSTNGSTWAIVAGTENTTFTSLAVGPTKMIAKLADFSNGTLVSTNNGATWARSALPFFSISYDNGKFIIATDNTVITSADSITWENCFALGDVNYVTSVNYLIDAGNYYAGVSRANNTLFLWRKGLRYGSAVYELFNNPGVSISHVMYANGMLIMFGGEASYSGQQLPVQAKIIVAAIDDSLMQIPRNRVLNPNVYMKVK